MVTMEVSKNLSGWGIILGASSGIGKASALKLITHGMNLILIYREMRKSESVFQEEINSNLSNDSQIIFMNENALDINAIQKVISEAKNKIGENQISFLLHSIARGNLKSLNNSKNESTSELSSYFDIESTDTSLSDEDLALTIHAMGSSFYTWVKKLQEENMFSDSVSIVGLTSEGNQKVWKNYAAVSAAKAVLESLAKSMAIEFASLGIRTNIIQSGVIPTPSMMMIPGSEKMLEFAKARNPMNRLTTPKDIANVVYLLNLPESKWLNGSLIKVDGGESLR